MTEQTFTISKDSNAERRASVRYPCESEAAFQPAGEVWTFQYWQAKVADISTGGIRLLLPFRYVPGTTLNVGLAANANSLPIERLARVVHVSDQVGSHWATGCAFAGQLSDDELKAFLGKAG